MLFLVIERFRSQEAATLVYERFRERGRMLPEGLKYLDSWVEENFDRCFQLMESDDPGLLNTWMACWNDLVNFEIVPVMSSADAAQKVAGTPDSHLP
jgi:Domain of unknown function (DUF3303)